MNVIFAPVLLRKQTKEIGRRVSFDEFVVAFSAIADLPV